MNIKQELEHLSPEYWNKRKGKRLLKEINDSKFKEAEEGVKYLKSLKEKYGKK